MGELCWIADGVDEVDDTVAYPEGYYRHHCIVDEHDNTRGGVDVSNLEPGCGFVGLNVAAGPAGKLATGLG